MSSEKPPAAVNDPGEDERLGRLDPERLRLLEQLRAQRRAPANAPPPAASAPPPAASAPPPAASAPPPAASAPPPANPWAANPWAANPWAAFMPSMAGSPWAGAFNPGGAFNATGGSASSGSPPPPRESTSAEQPLLSLRPEGDKPPLYIVHAIYGSVFPYHQLARRLQPGRPVYGLRARGLDDGKEPRTSIAEMATAYAAAISAAHPGGPIHLVGYSFGAWVAYAMAELLTREGQTVGLCAPMGVGAPASALAPEVGVQVETVASSIADTVRLMRNLALSEGREDPLGWLDQLPQSQRLLMAHNIAALRFQPPRSALPLDLVLTTEQHPFVDQDPTLGWKAVSTGAIQAHKLGGNHLAMFEEPQVGELAVLLDALLVGRDAA